MKKLYKKTMDLAGHPQAEKWLFGVSFVESSFFPLPPDLLLIPMCLQERAKAFRFALICTVASVLGGLAGYAIGMFFWVAIGDPVIGFYGLQEEFAIFEQEFLTYGFWIVFIFGITFFPYKVITIASGALAMNPVLFVLASLASRGLRFLIEAGLLWKFGERIRAFVEKRLALTVSVAVLLVAVLIIGYKLLQG